MDFFRSYYNKVFGPVYKSMGFQKHKLMFYRVKNDIVQSFELQSSFAGGYCTIIIGIVPLCIKNNINTVCSGPLHLSNIVYGRYKSWYYERNENDMKDLIEELLTLCNAHLDNLFSSVTNCSELYTYITNQKINLFIHSGVDTYSCLKCGYYDKALVYLTDLYELNKKNVNTNLESWKNDELGFPKMPEEAINDYIERANKDQNEMNDLINAIKENNVDYIEDLIKQNEEYTINELSVRKTK